MDRFRYLFFDACWGIFFYQERVTTLDTAFQFFSILKRDALAIQAYRYGAAITQVFPLLTSRLGLPLELVAMSYSVSFVLFYFGAFLFAWFKLKNPAIAIVILLFNTMMTAHGFFWAQCEVIQGAVFTLVYLGYVEQQMKEGIYATLFKIMTPFLMATIVFFIRYCL